MKFSRALPFVVALIPFSLIAGYLWNPLGVHSWDPRGRILGIIPYRNPSVAMEPTLAKGSYFIACTASYLHAKPLAGDIIVFWPPPAPNVPYVKRVVAIGGDSLEFSGGKLLLNGAPQDEQYVPAEHNYPEMGKTRVPIGSVYVMGDNRDNSYDSRHYGPVPEASIIGKVCVEF